MKIRTPLVLALLTLAALSAAQAQTVSSYRVTQSVGSLSLAQPGVADPYLFLDFQLTDAAGTNTAAVTISNLRLTGGAFDYDDRRLADLGNVVGSGNAFTLFGDVPLSDRSVLFRVTDPNAVLSYDLTLYQSGADAPTPDGFNAALLYRTGPLVDDFNVVPTLGPTFNEQVAYAFDGRSPQPLAYGVDAAAVRLRVSAAEAPRYTGLGLSTVTPQAVPEPASIAALGVGALALLRRRRR